MDNNKSAENKIRAGNVELVRDPEVVYLADKSEVSQNITQLRELYFGNRDSLDLTNPNKKSSLTVK